MAMGRAPDLAGIPGECDPFAQDCGDAVRSKCALVRDDGGVRDTVEPRCVAPTGALMAGATCAQADFGFDDCTAGLTCSTYPLAADGSRHCQKICSWDGQCPSGERCFAGRPPGPYGVCIRTCQPFGLDCGDGLDCDAFFADADGSTGFFACRVPGTHLTGESCVKNDDLDCAVNYICAPLAGDPACYPMCDVDHGCGGGTRCQPFLGVVLERGGGLCQ